MNKLHMSEESSHFRPNLTRSLRAAIVSAALLIALLAIQIASLQANRRPAGVLDRRLACLESGAGPLDLDAGCRSVELVERGADLA
jgi:hypothetical protein